MIVVVGMTLVMHSRHRPAMLVEPLRRPPFGVLGHWFAPGFRDARGNRARRRTLGQRRHLHAHGRPLGRLLVLLATAEADCGKARE